MGDSSQLIPKASSINNQVQLFGFLEKSNFIMATSYSYAYKASKISKWAFSV